MKAVFLFVTLVLSLNVFAVGENDKADCSQTKAQESRDADESPASSTSQEQVKTKTEGQ
jgi:hypothetical protein